MLNKRARRNRRGVEPIVATSLLVGFAVTVTAVVMMFGTDFVKDIQQKQGAKSDLSLGCSNMHFRVTDVKNNVITVQNDGTIDIHAFFVKYMGDTEKIEDHIALTVKKGEYGQISAAPVGGGVEDLKRVKVFAKHNAGPKGKSIWMTCSETETTAKI